jgi:predicted RNase H-like HicB family nuclease
MKTKSAKATTAGLHALVWKEDDWFVAKAIEVEIASQGKSKHDALRNLEEAIELFFEDEPIELKTIKPHQLVQIEQIKPRSVRYA